MKNVKNKKVISIISLVLAVLLLIVVVGVFVSLIPRAKSSSISVDGKTLTNGETLYVSESISFEVELSEFTVNVTANPSAPDFEYTVDGKKINHKSVDYSAAFTFSQTDKGFELRAVGLSILDISSVVFPGKEIITPDISLSKAPYFLLTIKSKKESYNFPLLLTSDAKEKEPGVFLDKETIIF